MLPSATVTPDFVVRPKVCCPLMAILREIDVGCCEDLERREGNLGNHENQSAMLGN